MISFDSLTVHFYFSQIQATYTAVKRFCWLSRAVNVECCHGLWRAVVDCRWLLWAVVSCSGLLRAIKDCRELSLAVAQKLFHGVLTKRLKILYDVARLILMAPINLCQNSTSFLARATVGTSLYVSLR